jgi:tryptophan halogenase
MRKRVLIVGGGTAGWLTAGYLAKRLGADLADGVTISLVESKDIGVLGVGEGTFPTIRRTLATIGVDEAELVRRCGATFKQGARFVHWQRAPGTPGRDHYMHPFQVAEAPGGLELLPYWLNGAAGDAEWDEVSTPQKAAADAARAPKLPTHPDYVGPLNYAFHFDAVALAGLLRERAVANGVTHLIDTVTHVALDHSGAIERVETERHGTLTADLYVDCTGFRAELIGKAMGVPFRSCRDVLFCDRALAAQLPYDAADAPIASQTISTAQEAGWIWDIGLDRRRGIGHVYSSDHSDDEAAERALRRYLGPRGAQAEVRRFRFDAGFREINWRRNCVAVGLSSGFFEPLEATGIAFAEVSAAMIANLFPWSGDLETSARQFNANMLRRYERALDFIKLHYCLSERRDTDFWRDNVADTSNTASLLELLDRWRHRWPNELDIDPQVDIFTEASWQYVLYGMGWRTDLSARAGALRYRDDARRAFGEVRRQVGVALANLPPHRALVDAAQRHGFGSAAA